MVRWSPR